MASSSSSSSSSTNQVASSAKMRAFEQRAAMEGVRKGLRAAAAACVFTAVPVLLGARLMPARARFYWNYAAQASVLSAATMGAYFIVADKANLASALAASRQRILQQRREAAASANSSSSPYM